MRQVWCRDRDTDRRLPENRCKNNFPGSSMIKPLTMESCANTGTCFATPTWKYGQWSEV